MRWTSHRSLRSCISSTTALDKTKAKTYAWIEWKKGLKSIPLFFLITVIGILLLLAALAVSRAASGSNDASLKIDVAVAGAKGDSMTEKAVTVVRTLDVVRTITRFHMTDTDEADQGIADGTYDAAIYLTGNMYEDINEGYNTPVVVRFSGNSVLEADLFRELIETGVKDLGIAESSIYAVYDLSREYPTAKKTRKIATKMAKRYIRMFLERTLLFDNELISSESEMTPLEYAVTSLMLIMMLLTGVGLAGFYSADEVVTGKALERTGIRRWYQNTVKIAVISSVIWLMQQIVSCILAVLLRGGEIRMVHPLATIPLAVGVAALIHLVYRVIPTNSAALVYLLVSVFMIIAGGGFFAPSSMPKAAEAVSRILPFSTWHLYLSKLLKTDGGAGGVCVRVLIGAVIMIALAAVLSRTAEMLGNRIGQYRNERTDVRERAVRS